MKWDKRSWTGCRTLSLWLWTLLVDRSWGSCKKPVSLNSHKR
jgi:hypothetical protein